MFKNILCITFSLLIFGLQVNLPACAGEIIQDEVAIESFRGQNLSKPVYKLEVIKDEVAEESFQGKKLEKPAYKHELLRDTPVAANVKSVPVYRYELLQDEVAIESFRGQHLEKPVYKYRLLDENSVDIEVVVSPVSFIKTNGYHMEISAGNNILGGGITEGDKIKFRVMKDVKKDNKLIIQRGTLVDAIIGNIVPRSTMGAPAEIIVESFVTQDIYGNKIELKGNISKSGLNLTPVIYLLVNFGAPFSFSLSNLLIFVPGGQAKLKPKNKFVLFYET